MPGTSLYNFDNQDQAGDWFLQIIDTVPGGDVGVFEGATLFITTYGTCVTPS